ncbi:MAG: hypothetical protein JWM93_2114 [Frankiales bacterium]|nr:hypothetical protein [Frankiales bacterium]
MAWRRSDAKSLPPLLSGLGRVEAASWRLTLYGTAGEAGGCFVPARRVVHVGVRGAAADPERARSEAARRARAKVRRFAAANGLNRLGTLTYRGLGCHDPKQLRADVAHFFRSLRAALGGDPLPYVWVSEWHKTGHGLHVHFAVGRYINRSLIAAAWGHGFVHIKLLSNLPVGSTLRDEARQAARYLSKYVTKSFTEHTPGLHRYELAQGFQPSARVLLGTSVDGVLRQACAVMSGEPRLRWSSSDADDWLGPPAVWFAWA